MQTFDFKRSVVVDDIKLTYWKSGHGKKSIALFHGFGQTHHVFSSWVTPLQDQFTLYIFDLPFHGESTAPNQLLKKETWKKLMQIFLEEEKIATFSIGGYSLGGRFVLATMFALPSKINQVILIAPDGIYTSFWYQFATHFLTKGVFKYFMKHPDHFNRLLLFFEKWNLASATLIKFARKELAPKDSRIRVYQSWVYLKTLKYPNSEITRFINSEKIPIHLFLSKKDYIVPYGPIIETIQNSPSRNLHWLNGKHHQLIDEIIEKGHHTSILE